MADQLAHGEAARAFGDGGYFWRWRESTLGTGLVVMAALIWVLDGS